MEHFAVILFLLMALVILSSLAERIHFPPPVMLMVAGLLIGLTPGVPHLALDPEVVFLIILPPLLFDAASKTAWYEFKAAIGPIATAADKNIEGAKSRNQ